MRVPAFVLSLLLSPLALARFTLPPQITSWQSDGLAATDSSWFYRNPDGSALAAGGGKLPKPEYVSTRASSLDTDDVVITRDKGDVAIAYTFYNPNSGNLKVYFTVDQPTFTRASSSAPDIALDADLSEDEFTIPGTGYHTVLVVYSGLPTTVGVGDINANITTYNDAAYGNVAPRPRNFTGYPDEDHVCHLYEVDAAPAGFMSAPWTEVLDLSCVMCDLKTGEAAMRQYTTTGLATSGYFSYVYMPQWLPENHKGKLALSQLLTTNNTRYGECRDVSSFLLLLQESQGYDGALKRYWTGQTNPDGSVRQFRTNPVRPIGQSSFSTINWNFHQILEGNGLVYDGCAQQRYDLSGNLYNQAPYGWSPAGYWQTAHGTGYVGLVDGYADSGTGSVPLTNEAGYWTAPPATDTPLLQGVF